MPGSNGSSRSEFSTNRWFGLRLKILAWSFVPTVIILGAVAVVIFYAYQDVTGNLVIGRNREVARLSASQVAVALDAYAGLLDTEARNPDLASREPATRLAALQAASRRLSLFDGGTLVLDVFGQVVATQPRRPEIENQDWGDRSYYQSLLRLERTTSAGPLFSDVITDGPGGTDVIGIAVPIRDPQVGLAGVLVGMFRVSATANNAFYGDLLKLHLAESGNAFLVDTNGRVIFHTDAFYIGGDFSALPDVQQAIQGQAGAMRTLDGRGQDIVTSFAPVPETSWGLIDHQRWSALLAGSQGYRRLLLLLLSLGVVVPAVVVTFGVRRITKPIQDLIAAAQKVAGGDFNQTISAHSGDEIEELGERFNQMAGELRQSYAKLEERAQARTQELAALNAIAALVSQSPVLEDTLKKALRETLQVMVVEAGGIYLLDEEAGLLTLAAQQGFSPEFASEIDRLKVGEGFSGRVAVSGQPVVVQDVSVDARLTRMAVREENLHSLAVVPISSKGKVLGTLFAMTHGYREFTEDDVQLLVSVGQQIGVAVENSRLFGQAQHRMEELEDLYRAERRRAEQFRVINEVGYRITSILATDELLQQMTRLIQKSFHYYHVGIGLIEGDEVVYRVGAGALWDDPQFQFKPARLKVGPQGISGWVAGSGEPLWVPDVGEDPRYVPMEGSEARSEVVVPIMVKGQVFGVLDVQSNRTDPFDDADVAVLQSLAHQAAVAIENARLYERAQQVAVMEERNRLARDLHDAVTQTLFSASLIAEAVPALWEADPDEGRAMLEQLRRLSRGALAEMRTLLLELRPAALVESSLADLLRQLGESAAGRSGLLVAVSVEHYCALPSEVHVALYRIAQEALNNVVKHASAQQVTIRLHCTPCATARGPERAARAELRVEDDGCGFDPARVPPSHLGLGILRERADAIGADLQIVSQPGQGTRIAAVWTADNRPRRVKGEPHE